MRTYLFQNNDNSHKYLEVRKYADGHYVWKQYIRHFAHTPFDSKNYTGCSLRRVHQGTWHRVSRQLVIAVLENYHIADAEEA